MMLPLMAKRGRKPTYWVVPETGEVVNGLGRRPDGRFYATTKPTKTFGRDPLQGVYRFRQWSSHQSAEYSTVEVDYPTPIPEFDKPELIRNIIDRRYFWDYSIPTADLGKAIRKMILTDPVRIAQITGIPDFANLSELQPSGPSPSLQELGDLYFEKRISRDELRHSKSFWKEFCKAMKPAVTARDIDKDVLRKYRDKILTRFHDGDVSNTYVKHRFGKIKSILRFAETEGYGSDDLTRLISHCRMLKPPEKTNGADAHPISVDDFHKLLSVSDSKFKAIFLTSLNCCYYAIDIGRLPQTAVNLENRTVIFDRQKTKTARVAVLWSRTVEAIKSYQSEFPHELPEVFATEHGTPYDAKQIQRNFRRRRKKAGISDSVKFNNLRDGAYTAAIEGGAASINAQILAGHRAAGIADHYIRRNPKMVADACEAIERHYFG